MRLSKQQKKILLCLKERVDKEYTTYLYDIKMCLWGSEPVLHSEGALGLTVHVRDRLPSYVKGNRYFSVKRSVLNLKDKGLIDMECAKLPKWRWVKPPPYFFLTDKGAKCVEDLLHNKKNGG